MPVVLVGGVAQWSCSVELLSGVAQWSCSVELLSGVAQWSCSVEFLGGVARCKCSVELLGGASWEIQRTNYERDNSICGICLGFQAPSASASAPASGSIYIYSPHFIRLCYLHVITHSCIHLAVRGCIRLYIHAISICSPIRTFISPLVHLRHLHPSPPSRIRSKPSIHLCASSYIYAISIYPPICTFISPFVHLRYRHLFPHFYICCPVRTSMPSPSIHLFIRSFPRSYIYAIDVYFPNPTSLHQFVHPIYPSLDLSPIHRSNPYSYVCTVPTYPHLSPCFQTAKSRACWTHSSLGHKQSWAHSSLGHAKSRGKSHDTRSRRACFRVRNGCFFFFFFLSSSSFLPLRSMGWVATLPRSPTCPNSPQP